MTTPTKDMFPTAVEIINQEIDCHGVGPSYYRMLVNKQYFKYITIDQGIYEVDDLCFPPILLEKLPLFPAGDWNYGHISQNTENPTPFFAETSRITFPSITPLWHPKSYDYLSLQIGARLRSNVYMASSPLFQKPIIAKFARFYWEIGYYIAETQAYSWIVGHGIGPEFLGYLTEEGRVIGFLIEFIKGRHPTIKDLTACGAVLIDFETAKKSGDGKVMKKEFEGLEVQLLDESGNGGIILEKSI